MRKLKLIFLLALIGLSLYTNARLGDQKKVEAGYCKLNKVKEEKKEKKEVVIDGWKLIRIGEASYYSEKGCLGCNKNLIMANGERLNDDIPTIALTPKTVRKYKLLNKFVKVVNRKNGKEVVVKVSDTGGFYRYGRVADLSLKTKELLSCAGLCEVEIWIK